jgi:hypothetical protein
VHTMARTRAVVRGAALGVSHFVDDRAEEHAASGGWVLWVGFILRAK